MATLWLTIVAFPLIAYVVLDGFDIGIGVIHFLLGKTQQERRVTFQALGPVWDGMVPDADFNPLELPDQDQAAGRILDLEDSKHTFHGQRQLAATTASSTRLNCSSLRLGS